MQCTPDPEWAWRGGHPGEMTGSEWERRLDAAYDVAQAEAEKLGVDVMKSYPTVHSGLPLHEVHVGAEAGRMAPTAEGQIRASSNAEVHALLKSDGIWVVMEGFAALETADVPRQWTARVAVAIATGRTQGIDHGIAEEVSATLKALHVEGQPDMTASLRTSFLSLVASGKLTESAAVRQLAGSLTAEQMLTAMVLLRDGWEGTSTELLEVSRRL